MWSSLQAGDGLRRGVTWAAGVVLVLVALLVGSTLPIGFGPVLDLVAGTVLFLVAAAVITMGAAVAARLLWLLGRAVSWKAFLLLVAGIGTVMVISGMALIVILPVAVPILLLGAVLGAAFDGQWPERSWWSRGALIVIGGVAVVALVYVTATFVDQGSSQHLAEIPDDPVAVEPLAVADPSQPGPFAVQYLTYGSGEDQRRSEYGEDVDLLTESVDGSELVSGSKGWQMRLRSWYWGFDEEAMPINGRVWYPEGSGPFPLVLVVHGNHSMEEPSDPGYEWLGRLLASRGFIVVSVDENFLNGSFRGSPNRENDARAWILLEHLRVWQRWSEESGGPFAGRVDMDRVGLIGHSRGGEAVAIAAAFNRLERYPDDATIGLPHGFAIRSVVAIAPSDGQYEPMDRPTPLNGVSYLTLQGGHDADVSVFMGARQWRRTTLEEGQIKASVWAYRANHGQFNTVWGRTDYPWPFSRLLNLAPLLSGEEQRRLGGVTISAFLEATLHDRDEYRRLFRDLRTAEQWLPDDLYITRYEDSSFVAVADFEGDIDVTTGKPGVEISGNDLAVWREDQLGFRGSGSKRNGVAVVGWRFDADTVESEAASPMYELRLEEELSERLQIDVESVLVLNLADTGNDPPRDDQDGEGADDGAAEEAGDEEPEADAEDAESVEPLDLSVEVGDAAGVVARLPLSTFKQLPPPVDSRMTKLPAETHMYGSAWETTLQTFELPLTQFLESAPELDPSSLQAIRLVFDRSPEGVIVVDDVGFARPTP